MGGQQRQRQGLAVRGLIPGAVLLLSGLSAVAGSRNDNFAHTVGGDVASLAKQQHVDRHSAGARSLVQTAAAECEICAAPTPLQWRQEHSLDQRLRSQYRQLGEQLAAKLWDDPRGRRIKFDIEGRPGLGLEIPLD